MTTDDSALNRQKTEEERIQTTLEDHAVRQQDAPKEFCAVCRSAAEEAVLREYELVPVTTSDESTSVLLCPPCSETVRAQAVPKP